MSSLDTISIGILLGALLVLAGILSSLVALRFGAPLLLVFLLVGMLAGEAGPLGIAANDDMRQPEAKDKLKQAFAAANVPAEIELYPNALHGWCVPDMPPQGNTPVYNKPDAERAWAKLVALYKTALA